MTTEPRRITVLFRDGTDVASILIYFAVVGLLPRRAMPSMDQPLDWILFVILYVLFVTFVGIFMGLAVVRVIWRHGAGADAYRKFEQALRTGELPPAIYREGWLEQLRYQRDHRERDTWGQLTFAVLVPVAVVIALPDHELARTSLGLILLTALLVLASVAMYVTLSPKRQWAREDALIAQLEAQDVEPGRRDV